MMIVEGKNGSRIASGNTDHGDYCIEVFADHTGPLYDAEGNHVCDMQFTIKTPPVKPLVLSDEQVQRQAARKQVCDGCEHLTGYTQAGINVKCDQCTNCTKGHSLISESAACPIGKW